MNGYFNFVAGFPSPVHDVANVLEPVPMQTFQCFFDNQDFHDGASSGQRPAISSIFAASRRHGGMFYCNLSQSPLSGVSERTASIARNAAATE